MKLYLGLRAKEGCLHYPIIQVVPRSFAIQGPYTHIIFTSQTAVDLFFQQEKGNNALFIAVGAQTKKRIEAHGCQVALTPEEETAEGLIVRLAEMEWRSARVLWPHSALSRPLLEQFFIEREIPIDSPILYDVQPHFPGPLPDHIEEIIFTSPSTVHAYIHFFGSLPHDKKLTPIGEVTKKTLSDMLKTKTSKRSHP